MPFISEVSSIFIQRFYTGWITLRNQLVTPIKLMGRRVIELYDALLAGNDWEVTPVLSLKRRAGHTSYATVNFPAQLMYSWKSNTMGTIPIIDTTGDVEFIGASGATVIATKGVGTGQNIQSSVLGIGNYLYVGNPQQSFKWDGPTGIQGKTNWGISIGSNASSVTELATAGANFGGSGVAWTNPSNVGSAVSYATAALTGTAPSNSSQYVQCSTFGFALAAGSVITGIEVLCDVIVSAPNATSLFTAILQNNGSPLSGGKPIFVNSATPQTITFGSPTDNWGASLTTGLINASTFGVLISGQQNVGSAASTFSLKNVRIKVSGNLVSGPTATPTGVGSFSAVNGFVYVYAYGNSASGEISNATQVSNNTGPFTNVSYVGLPVTASNDPQVNQIRVYRTTDSGGGNQFFEISNSPFANTSATIQDTTPDTSLQVTSQAEINLGNTPPPAGLTNLCWWSGRMWGSTNNLLWASTGAETISGTAPNSNWNPAFQFVIPGVIVRNVPWTSGLLVFTQDDCYIVRGTDITNYTINEFIKDFGVRTYNAIDTDGTNLYVFTSDRQFILLSSSGAQDIGQPIADQLLNVDSTACYVKVNRYGQDSVARILDTVNNIYYDFNLNQQCWQLPGILAMPSCTAMGSIETSPAVWRLLLSSNNVGTVTLAYRDITQFTDLGTSYAPKAVFGSIQLADPGNLAKIGARGGMTLEFTEAGSLPTLLVLPNDTGATLSNAVGSQITGNFVSLSVGGNPLPDPPTLGAQPKNYRSVRYYYSAGRGLSAFVRNIQFQLQAPAENKATELIGWGIFGDEKGEAPQGQLPQLQGR